jgi:hypothetical protein
MKLLAVDALTLLDGGIRLVDLTQDGVQLRVADGVEREAAVNQWFSRHVPRRPWRKLTLDERLALDRPAAPASPTTLVIMDFPGHLRAEFWDNFAPALFSVDEDASRKSLLDAFRAILLETLETMPGIAVRSVRTFDFMVAPPGASSTAFDARSNQHVGLHLDDHESLGFVGRSRGFALLSINLGHADRFFQFVNHDAESLLSLVGGVPALPEAARSAASLVQTFFGTFPSCPVARVTLRPGQGYLGVTQDFIHDGSTNDEGRPDVSCLLGGRFAVDGVHK